MSTTPDTEAIILDLLKRAAEAQGVYEKAELGGKHDTNWPQWHAAHMTRALAEAGYRIGPADRRRPPDQSSLAAHGPLG